MKRNIRLQQSALVLALAAAYPVIGHGAAGTTQFTAGDVTMRRGNAAPVALAKGTVLESGDAITTGSRGVAQVKFSDGGYVAIQPNSQFDITRYADRGDASQDSFLVNLARGGMRAITGLIGKRNTANYKVTTNTATVGIRGSAFFLAYNPDGTLSVSTEQDAIEVCTAAGCVGLTAGESALVPNNNELPTRTNARTSTPLVAFRADPQIAGDQTNADGTQAILGDVAPTVVLTGQALVGTSYSDSYGEGAATPRYSEDGALAVQGGKAYGYLDTYNYAAKPVEGATVSTYGTRGTIAGGDFITLGVWSQAEIEGSGYYGGSSLVDNFAFVAGSFTPSSTMTALEAGSMTGSYSLAAATPVYGSNGAVGTLNSASMGMNFGTGSGTIALDVTMPFGGSSLHYALGGDVYMYGEGSSGFYGNSIYTGEGEGSANGRVRGFFGGPNAQNVGLSFSAYDWDHYYTFGGAAILTGSVSSPAEPLSGIAFAGGGFFNGYNGRTASGSSTATVDGSDPDRYLRFVFSDGEGNMIDGSLDSEATFTKYASVDLGSDGKLVLASWRYSTWNINGGGEGEGSGYFYRDPFAFVAGKPTADMSPVANTTATYNLRDASPLFRADNSDGTLDYATLSVNFGSGTNNAQIALGFTAAAYGGGSTSVDMTGTVSGSGSSFSGGISGTHGSSGGVTGHFYGSGAQYAGIGYSGYYNDGEFAGAAILENGYSASPPSDGQTFNLASASMFGPGGTAPMIFGSGVHVFRDGYLRSGSDLGSQNFGSAANSSFNALNAGTNEFIGWGKWAGGTAYTGGSEVDLTNAHYVVGSPTPSGFWGSMTGTATYTADATRGTTPTTTGGSLGAAAFSSATLDLTFGSTPTVGATVVVNYGGTQYSGTVNNMPVNTGNSTFSGSESGHQMGGLFVGPTAGYAGLTYSLNGGSTYGTVTGAAVLTRN